MGLFGKLDRVVILAGLDLGNGQLWQVTEIAGENNSLIELRVAKEDIGKVIGKEGRTAQSMRTLLSAVSTKLGRRAHLDIVD